MKTLYYSFETIKELNNFFSEFIFNDLGKIKSGNTFSHENMTLFVYGQKFQETGDTDSKGMPVKEPVGPYLANLYYMGEVDRKYAETAMRNIPKTPLAMCG